MLRPFRGVLPTVDPSAYVDQSAQVIGDVHIGEASSVWMNAVVRGDVHWIRIGARTNIQDGSVVHVMNAACPTTVGDEVTVGHGAILHGCTVASRVLVGMGAILLNEVEVGEDSIVAAGSLLPERMRVPPRSLVMGSPAKVRRELAPEEITSIVEYSRHYVGYRLEYMPAEACPPEPQRRRIPS